MPFRRKEETHEGYALIDWWDRSNYAPHIKRNWLFHIANGGSRHPLEAMSLKRQGVRAGISDYQLVYPKDGYHGLWIELKKRKGGRLTKEQKEWLDNMVLLGYSAHVANGADEAIAIIKGYLRCG